MPKRAGVNRAAPFTTVIHIPTQAGLDKRLFGELAKLAVRVFVDHRPTIDDGNTGNRSYGQAYAKLSEAI